MCTGVAGLPKNLGHQGQEWSVSFWRPQLIKSTDSADYHFATPLPATPGETLGKSVNLIVVATGKGDQLGDEFFQPSGALGKSDGSSGEQVGLGNQARTLVGVGLIGPDVDGLLAETLNETKADRKLSIRRVEGWYLRLRSMTFRFSVSNGKRPRTTSRMKKTSLRIRRTTAAE